MNKLKATPSSDTSKCKNLPRRVVEAEILQAIRAETEAYLRGDFEGVADCWLQDETAIRMVSWGTLGTKIIRGWEEVSAQVEEAMIRYPAKMSRFEDCIRWENLQVVVRDDMARVIYDQIGICDDPGFQVAGVQHELKVLLKVNGAWKINSIAIFKPSFQHMEAPLLEVNADGRILWRNSQALVSLDGHGGLKAVGGRLKARNRAFDAALREAIQEIGQTVFTQFPVQQAAEAVRAVPLGEDENCTPQYCWVYADDGRVLVALDDSARLDQRLVVAAQIFGLSSAQQALARLLIDGCDLASAAERLEVSVNTVRTQLQRIFDKTGVRSQAGLVRTLLCVQSPS